MTIFSDWCGSQSIHPLGIDLFQHSFKTDCRRMVTFIDNHHTIVSDKRLHLIVRNARLQKGNVNFTVQRVFC